VTPASDNTAGGMAEHRPGRLTCISMYERGRYLRTEHIRLKI